ncbi:hypothetical protein [Phytoactinopolyspora endophytica]|uniref:hypothetical protein n=1 Tax=Phytoactinopolyspora endophytica TaxID=1642495 RepID=UPI00101E1599|nr:hypothetical protein [Phytoactinopolyspora endophytica]
MWQGPAELRELAHRVAEMGPAAVAAELDEFARCAAEAGVEPLLLAVLCDRREAAVVRQRAFARAAAQLDRRREGTPTDIQPDGHEHRRDAPERGGVHQSA